MYVWIYIFNRLKKEGSHFECVKQIKKKCSSGTSQNLSVSSGFYSKNIFFYIYSCKFSRCKINNCFFCMFVMAIVEAILNPFEILFCVISHI